MFPSVLKGIEALLTPIPTPQLSSFSMAEYSSSLAIDNGTVKSRGNTNLCFIFHSFHFTRVQEALFNYSPSLDDYQRLETLTQNILYTKILLKRRINRYVLQLFIFDEIAGFR
ncbi:hypothetical protein THF1C08_360051 [Vibrio jasicida]|uniref:Uncharacterized protein n=1 Tax=Vibrio jasicida TaxID=766224 RepID=A0AAU9QSH1_9VIBR|nr:hypothetical protein THF1C08_360051 [Vibrio jasicida]CAH1598488.1 hypothetical protein THF1A12_360052 [Vibrio jasicida]